MFGLYHHDYSSTERCDFSNNHYQGLSDYIDFLHSDYCEPLSYSSLLRNEEYPRVSGGQERYSSSLRWNTLPYDYLDYSRNRKWSRERDANSHDMLCGLNSSDKHPFLRHTVDGLLERGRTWSMIGQYVDFVPRGFMNNMAYGPPQRATYSPVLIPDAVEERNRSQYANRHDRDEYEPFTVSATQIGEANDPTILQNPLEGSACESEVEPVGVPIPGPTATFMSQSPESDPSQCQQPEPVEPASSTQGMGNGMNQTHEWASDSTEIDGLREFLQELRKEGANIRREQQSFQQLNQDFKALLKRMERGWRCMAEQRPTWRHEDRNPSRTGNNGHFRPNPNPGASESHHDIREHTDPENMVKAAFERYIAAWLAILSSREDAQRAVENLATSSVRAIPWPTPDLQMSSLSRFISWNSNGFNDAYDMDSPFYEIPSEITGNSFQLQRWNAFCFFVRAFGLTPYYDKSVLEFHIRATGPLGGNAAGIQKLMALKAQLLQEKRKWHPDKLSLRLSRAATGSCQNSTDSKISEAVKAVWGAVMEASRACEACLDEMLRREENGGI